jgi:hypothetical protein
MPEIEIKTPKPIAICAKVFDEEKQCNKALNSPFFISAVKISAISESALRL